MKIKKLILKDFQQFKDFELDLTYPAGHEKAGEPLEKVCLIGQSGTGKTTVLNVLKDMIEPKWTWSDGPYGQDLMYAAQITRGRHDDTIYRLQGEASGDDLHVVDHSKWDKNHPEDVAYDESRRPWLINFPAETIFRDIDKDPSRGRSSVPKTMEEIERGLERFHQKIMKQSVFDFAQHNPRELFEGILLEWERYDLQLEKWERDLVRQVMDNGDRIPRAARDAFDQWERQTPNPMKKLAAVLDPVLNRFKVKIKTRLESSEERSFIPLQTMGDQDIPFPGWSTGTKQLILTAAPLYYLNTQNTVVLIDEPERSLYPDVQYDIVKFYQGIAPGSQQFFATHSPIIASSFEPWEIVELEFSGDGTVRPVPYYDTAKARHVDHYKKDPRYLRWDSILMRLFNMDEEGNSLREDAMMELSSLDLKIERLSKQPNPDKQKLNELVDQYRAKAAKLDWKLEPKL